VAQVLDTDKLIDSIKRRASIPSNQSTYTEDDFLAFINEEMSLSIVPSILRLYEGHFLFQETTDLVDEKSDYRIPTRAIGNKLNELQYVDNNNNRFEMTRITTGDIPDYQGAYTQNHAYAYYVEYNKIKLLPPIQGSASGSLLFYYYIRPNEMVEESRVAKVVAGGINRTTGEITVDKIPDHFSTDITYDMYMAGSPHAHMVIEKTATSVNSVTKTLTFALDDIPDDLEDGDHIAMKCECIIPQIPSDLHVLLAQYVAERILEAQGDTQGLQNAKAKTREMENKAGTIIDNRVDEAPLKIVNRHGTLRSGLSSKRYKRRN